MKKTLSLHQEVARGVGTPDPHAPVIAEMNPQLVIQIEKYFGGFPKEMITQFQTEMANNLIKVFGRGFVIGWQELSNFVKGQCDEMLASLVSDPKVNSVHAPKREQEIKQKKEEVAPGVPLPPPYENEKEVKLSAELLVQPQKSKTSQVENQDSTREAGLAEMQQLKAMACKFEISQQEKSAPLLVEPVVVVHAPKCEQEVKQRKEEIAPGVLKKSDLDAFINAQFGNEGRPKTPENLSDMLLQGISNRWYTGKPTTEQISHDIQSCLHNASNNIENNILDEKTFFSFLSDTQVYMDDVSLLPRVAEYVKGAIRQWWNEYASKPELSPPAATPSTFSIDAPPPYESDEEVEIHADPIQGQIEPASVVHELPLPESMVSKVTTIVTPAEPVSVLQAPKREQEAKQKEETLALASTPIIKELGILKTFIGPHGLMDEHGNLASELEKKELIREILLAVLDMHQKNNVHQNIKPHKIMVCRITDPLTNTSRLGVQIFDLKFIKFLLSPDRAIAGTYEYASPEIFMGSSDVLHPDHEIFHVTYKKLYSPGRHAYEASLRKGASPHPEHAMATKSNDIWSVGVTLYRIMFGQLPNNISEVPSFLKRVRENPLLEVCLNSNAKERTIESALKQIDALIVPLYQEAVGTPESPQASVITKAPQAKNTPLVASVDSVVVTHAPKCEQEVKQRGEELVPGVLKTSDLKAFINAQFGNEAETVKMPEDLHDILVKQGIGNPPHTTRSGYPTIKDVSWIVRHSLYWALTCLPKQHTIDNKTFALFLRRANAEMGMPAWSAQVRDYIEYNMSLFIQFWNEKASQPRLFDVQSFAKPFSAAMPPVLSVDPSLCYEAKTHAESVQKRVEPASVAGSQETFVSNMQRNIIRWIQVNDQLEKSHQLNPGSYTEHLRALHYKRSISAMEYELYKQTSPDELLALGVAVIGDSSLPSLQDDGYRCLKRDITKLPRTFTLAYSKDKESEEAISMYVSSNKLAHHCDNSKNKLNIQAKKAPVEEGSWKLGKRAWKLSAHPPEPYFRLRSKKKDLIFGQEHPFAGEAACAAQFAPHVDVLENCMFYRKKEEVRAVAYSKKALGPLRTFINDHGLIDEDKKQVSELAKLKVIRDILLSVSSMHQKDYVHQDIKPENILIYRTVDPLTNTPRLSAKISDFGTARSLISHNRGIEGAFEYASPEVFMGSSDASHRLYDFFHVTYVNKFYSYGREIYLAAKAKCDQPLPEYTIGAKSNDMWSIGITLYRILYGNWPHLGNETEIALFKQRVRGNKLLQPFLNLNKAERITIEVALIQIDALIQKEELPSRPRLAV